MAPPALRTPALARGLLAQGGLGGRHRAQLHPGPTRTSIRGSSSPPTLLSVLLFEIVASREAAALVESLGHRGRRRRRVGAPADRVIRRLVVLALLVGGAVLLEPLRAPTEGVIAPRSLFLFGILLLTADTFGALAHDLGTAAPGGLPAGRPRAGSVGHGHRAGGRAGGPGA